MEERKGEEGSVFEGKPQWNQQSFLVEVANIFQLVQLRDPKTDTF